LTYAQTWPFAGESLAMLSVPSYGPVTS
jgi:hypothetical protein